LLKQKKKKIWYSVLKIQLYNKQKIIKMVSLTALGSSKLNYGIITKKSHILNILEEL